ncbi:MAG TPA: hypothetical protein VGE52_07370 [Pirellulales bacterium]
MSDLTTLQNVKTQILARIEELTAQPKPNYSIDGQQVSWQSLLDSLWNKLEDVDRRIAAAEPFEILSRGGTE